MDFFKWFSSERRVLKALEQSVGYDMSPNVIDVPANINDNSSGGKDKGNLSLMPSIEDSRERTAVVSSKKWG